ncbi:16042_t:CDS:2 [Rhizophagus irregularis]|nr:16042_t:CDS:2 [Rhizophagus irregularis]
MSNTLLCSSVWSYFGEIPNAVDVFPPPETNDHLSEFFPEFFFEIMIN